MSHSETCKFGHVFEVYDHDEESKSPNEDVRSKIKDGEIQSLEEMKRHTGTEKLASVMGDTYKQLKVSASTQGLPYTVAWTCADKFDEELGYNTEKTTEDIFVSPQSNLHDEFVQRKQQAEQRLNQTLGNLAERRQQKHLLEHDIRKLRSRVEALQSGDETQIKADFVELVDGAGAGGQQGGDEAALKFYRDNNIYPSIVADFYEMDGLDDLKKEKNHESIDKDGKLAHLPANEKAILRKKWVMYEKWKDLYGSEIQRKLRELKKQLSNVERSVEEVKDWLEPYARDAAMINQTSTEELEDKMTFYPTLRGSASMRRDLEFVCYMPLEKEGETMKVVDDAEHATHFKIILIYAVHANLAGGEQPNSPAQGPSSVTVQYYPAVVCEHVFERIFQQKIDKQKNHFRNMVEDYQGDLETESGDKLREAREESGLSVRELREEIGEELGERPPLELSSTIRRIEDGIDGPGELEEKYGTAVMEAVEKVLEINFGGDPDSEKMYSDTEAAIRKFMGQTDEYVIPEHEDPLFDLIMEIKFDYYYDYKLGLGLYTVK